MERTHVDDAVELLESASVEFDPESLSVPQARELLTVCARGRKLFDFLITGLARRVDDAAEVSRATGTSMGKAKETITTGRVARESEPLGAALQRGDISLDQAAEIARAEGSVPGAARELVTVAQEESFHVLKDKARRAKLEAERQRDLAARQRAARSARSHVDELGMVDIHLSLEPHVGAPIVARAEAEAEAERRSQKARRDGDSEPFERHLADAYAVTLQGAGKGPARRPELVVLVSHEVARRGWTDVREGEHCHIPRGRTGVSSGRQGDSPRRLLERRVLRWSRSPPLEALE